MSVKERKKDVNYNVDTKRSRKNGGGRVSRKTFRPPRIKKNGIKVQWGKIDGEECLCLVWDKGLKADAWLAMNLFTCGKYSLDFSTDRLGIGYKLEPSFEEEIIKRGYDITTLKFSIEKRKGAEK